MTRRDRLKTNGVLETGAYVHVRKEQVCRKGDTTNRKASMSTTHRFIDPPCQCAPVLPVCLSTHILSFAERNNIQGVSIGAEMIFTSLQQQTNICSRSSFSKRPPPQLRLLISFPLQAEAGLLGAGLSSPFMTRTQIRGNGGGRRRCPPTATQPFVSRSSGSGHPPTPPSPPPRLSSTAGEAAASSGIDSPHST